ncbi:MAG: hypothetical protein AB1510_12020 [Bacillota bacterium]
MQNHEAKKGTGARALEGLNSVARKIKYAFGAEPWTGKPFNSIMLAVKQNLWALRDLAAEIRHELPGFLFHLRSLLLRVNRNLAFALRNFSIPRRILLVAGMIPVWLFAGLLYQRFHPEALIVKKALAAVERPGNITYYKVSGRLGDVPHTGAFSWEARYWIDYRRGIVKSVRRSAREIRELTAVTHLKPGSNVNGGGPGRTYQSVFVGDAPLPLGNRVLDAVTQYHELLGKGRVRLLSEERVGSVETYKLKALLKQPESAGSGSEVEIINIRKDNYRPLKVIYEVWDGREQESTKLKSETATFGDVRLVNPHALGESFFALQAPAGDEKNVTRTLTYDEARGFKEYDLYYLGRSFEGLRLGSVVYAKQGRRSRLNGVPASRVMVDYTTPDHSNELRLTIRPALKASLVSSVLSPAGRVTRVKVGGKTARLNEIKYNGSAFYRAFINTGNSTVEIIGGSKNLVLKASGGLERLSSR